MHHAGRTRSALRVAIICGFVVLALSVFAWGLHAKLSLYEAHAVPSTATVAKLLTSQKTALDLVFVPPASPPSQYFREFVLSLVGLFFLLPVLRVLWLTPETVPGRRHDDSGDPAVCSRPPPIFA
jgi:hypothetical protein